MNIVLTYACRLPVSQVTRYLLYCEKVLKVHSVFINVIRVGTHFFTVLTFVSSIRLTVGLHYSLNKHMVQFRKNSKTAALLLRYPNHIRPRDKSFHVGTFRIMSIFSVISTKWSYKHYWNTVYGFICPKQLKYD